MKKPLLSKTGAACGFSLLLVAPLAAQADTKIERLTHFSEVTGIAAHDSDTTSYIQGDKKREENLRKFTGSVLGAWQKFRGEDNGSLDVDIYLVDSNKHYDLDPKKKTYSEDAIYDPSQANRGGNSGGRPDASQQQPQKNDDDIKVTKNELTVKDTGNSKNINGFDAHEYLITWDVQTENTKTGEKGRDLMTTDMWTSGDGKLVKARQDELAYAKAYLKLMQVQMPSNSDDMKQFGFGTVYIDDEDRKKFFDKLASIKGLPVSTDVTWEVGGSDAKGSTSNAGAQQAQANQSLDSALGSLFGSKKQDSSSSSNTSPAPHTAGMTTMFSSHVEVKSVDNSSVDASLFTVPSDYKTD